MLIELTPHKTEKGITCEMYFWNETFFFNVKNVSYISCSRKKYWYFPAYSVYPCVLRHAGSRWTIVYVHSTYCFGTLFSVKFREPLFSWINFNRQNLRILNELLSVRNWYVSPILSWYWDKFYSFICFCHFLVFNWLLSFLMVLLPCHHSDNFQVLI